MMDDINEMAKLHSAGATVRNSSPFKNLPTYKNDNELSSDFIKKWAAPFYLEIASYGGDAKWIDSIKEIKNEITTEVCQALLGDFNWRTRLVGSYFAAIKGYTELIDIIGTHLIKSEVCCVGHIYALALAFANNEKSIQYLNAYLDYYLTKPDLYFDQKYIMEALLFLDRQNSTSNFNRHIDNWNLFAQERKNLDKQSAVEIAKMLEDLEGKRAAENYLRSLATEQKKKVEPFKTDYFDKQIAILAYLKKYSY